jgi:hypothetical protein
MSGLGIMAFSKLYPNMQNIVDNLIIVDVTNRVNSEGKSNQTLLDSLNKLSLKNKSIN